MKDLDFDEIDRAVNSLNSDKPTDDNSDNTATSVQPVDERSTTSVESTPTLASRRSSGKFMDVVHPSSNMRRSPLISRDSSLTPQVKPIDNSDKSSENDNPIAPIDDSPTSDTISSTSPSSDDGWPDPIDFHESKKAELDNDGKFDSGHIETETNTETETEIGTNNADEISDQNQASNNDEYEDADIDKISDDINNELDQSHDKLPDSPFISGTKVKKRPLGAFSSEATAPTTDQVKTDEVTDTNNNEVNNTPETVVVKDTTLPAELQDDLLLIESGDSSTNPDKPTTIDNPVAVEAVAAVKTDIPAATVTQSAGPTSITQQYKEKPSTGDQTSGAIYNTDAYHKSLVRPAKKKSGWMWVFYIIILIVVGIGVGVGVSFVLSLL